NVIDNQEKFKDMKVPNGFTFINSKKDKKPSPEEEIYQKYFQENEIAKKYAFFSRELNNYIFEGDRKSTRLNSSHVSISYAVFCLKKKKKKNNITGKELWMNIR